MAVSVNTPSTANLRSDYMISDAALPQRNMDAANEGSSKFEEMLAQAEKTNPKLADVKEAIDSGKYDVPTIEDLEKAGIVYVDKQTGRVHAEDPKALAKQLLSGNVKPGDIPSELLSPELLIELAKLKGTGSEKAEDEDFFKPAEDSVKVDLAKQLQNSGVLAELAQIISAMAGEEPVFEVAGEVPEAEELVVAAVAETIAPEMNAQALEDEMPEQLIAAMPEVKSEKHEEKPETEVKARSFDEFVMNEAKDTAEIPVVEAKSAETPDNKADAKAESNAEEIPDELKALGEEKLDILSRAAEKGEIKVLYAGKKEDAPETYVVNIDVPVEEAKAPEAAERTQRPQNSKEVGEELEMLRSAKSKTAEQQSVPVSAEEPLKTDSPIVFKRESGEITVRPSQIVDQVMKAVDEAIKVNKEQTEYSLVLNPEELGKITVKLTKATDGAVSVTILAESARTQRILEQHSDIMQSNLKAGGINLESWQTVRESQQEAYAEDYNGSRKNPYFTRDNESGEETDEEGRSFADIIAAM